MDRGRVGEDRGSKEMDGCPLTAYVHSNKWAMDPGKLTQFTKNKLVATAADRYLHHIIHEEMPCGFK
jgi:hypothetical protein